MPREHEQAAPAPAHATGAVEFVSLADLAADESFRLRPDGDVTQLATSLGRLGQLAPVELRPWAGGAGDGPRWQVVSGFRRLGAIRLLARERVLARLHGELSEGDAWGLALSDALLRDPLTGEELEALRVRLRASGVAPWADELIDEALVRAPVSPDLRQAFYDFLRAAPAAPGLAVSAEASTTTPEPTPEPEPILGGQPIQEARPIPEAQPILDGQPIQEAQPQPADDVVEVTPEELVHDLTARLYGVNQDLATALDAWQEFPAEGRRALLEQVRYLAALLPYLETTG